MPSWPRDLLRVFWGEGDRKEWDSAVEEAALFEVRLSGEWPIHSQQAICLGWGMIAESIIRTFRSSIIVDVSLKAMGQGGIFRCLRH